MGRGMNKLLALAADPETAQATRILDEAHIDYQVVDVVDAGIDGFLDRDLDVKYLPCLLAMDRKIEGLEAIRGFANSRATELEEATA
jgi:hypothetical protein